jgi:hypothetical protein
VGAARARANAEDLAMKLFAAKVLASIALTFALGLAISTFARMAWAGHWKALCSLWSTKETEA